MYVNYTFGQQHGQVHVETSNCQYKPVYTLYVRTFVCTCMCVNYTFGQQNGQVHVETYLHTKHVAYYVLL